MQVPAAMFIESAVDTLGKGLPAAQVMDQWKELEEAVGPCSQDKKDGYTLGLQVARVILRENPELIQKGIDPQQLL